MIASLIRVVNKMRAHRIRHTLQQQGVSLSNVRISHRLLLKRESGSIGGEHFRVGENSSLEGRFVVGKQGRIVIGRHCSFRLGTHFSAMSEIEIGDHVFGAEDIFVTDNDNHPTSPSLRRQMTLTTPGSASWKMTEHVATKPVRICEGVWIGKSAIILKGVTVGRWSIVAAGAIVTKDVPPFSVVAGNPGRVVKTIDDDLPPDVLGAEEK